MFVGQYSVMRGFGAMAFVVTIWLWAGVSWAQFTRMDANGSCSWRHQQESQAKRNSLGLALVLREALERLDGGRKAFDAAHAEGFSSLHHVFLERRVGSSMARLVYQVEESSNGMSHLYWYEQWIEPCRAWALEADPHLLSSWTQEWDRRPETTKSVGFSGVHRLLGVDVFQMTSPEGGRLLEEESEGRHERTIGVFWGEHWELAVFFNHYDVPLAVQSGAEANFPTLVEMSGFENGLGVQHRVQRTDLGVEFQMLISDCGVADDLGDWSVYGDLSLLASREVDVKVFEMTQLSIANEACGME